MERVRRLRRAERLVTINPEIMGGNPVFRRTRVPVHMIAEKLQNGEAVERLREDYPRITEEIDPSSPRSMPQRTRCGGGPESNPGMTDHRSPCGICRSPISTGREVSNRRVSKPDTRR